ncbi:MAG: undecaprenyl phosphate-alpha-L-ara4N flippase subunit ArnF [Glaciecola sp.]|jgi:undecaprenyl phosphate-alpha-L-ara4N flippase subunit ArnF
MSTAASAGLGLNAATWLILGISITLATTGQLLLKAGMDRVGELSVGQIGTLIGQVLTTWQLLVGLAVFGASSIFWLITLSRVPLSTAYPIVSLSYVAILGLSWVLLGERPSLTVWVGALLIMCGVSLIGIGQR